MTTGFGTSLGRKISDVSLGSSLKLLVAGVAWRSLDHRASGQTLLEAVSSDDEQDRMLAGMSLVKAGEKSVTLIEKASRDQDLTPNTVRLLADIGGPRSHALLTEIAEDKGTIGEAAVDSLDLLERIESLDSE